MPGTAVTQPNYADNGQSGSAYPTAIDAITQAMARIAAAFNPHAVPAAAAAPVLTSSPGGSLGARTYYSKITYVTPAGEVTPSAESSLALVANTLLNVASPTFALGVTGWNVYVSTATGTETKQNSTPIALGTNWVEPTGGLISGAVLPAGLSLMAAILDAGAVFYNNALTEVAAQSLVFTAPTTNPRIDRIVIDPTTGVASIVAGTEAASPSPPAVPAGKQPVTKVPLSVGQTSIANSNITDERNFTSPKMAGDTGTGGKAGLVPAPAAGDAAASKFLKADGIWTVLGAVTNAIGTPGAQGFGVGICPSPPPGMTELAGCRDSASENYGNYMFQDGSIMVWIPAFYYKWGTGANGVALNDVSIAALSAYADEATANAAGFALHRSFKDGGANKTGFFVDKYICSNNDGVASSLRWGNPLSSNSVHNPFSGLDGAPANFYYGAIAAAKTRGQDFFCSSRFIFAALALLSYAHAKASTVTTYCAWYDATNNFPKGCNNNALGDAQDTALTFVSDGYSNACKVGSANVLAKTAHNGQNSGVADLNGCMWEITPGFATDAAGTGYYILKTSATMKNVTGGITLATDLWGATGLAALYDSLGATYEAALATSTLKYYGSASQVFDAATSGNAWNWAGAGAPKAAGVGGTNLFGNDGFWDFRPADMCALSGGSWNDSGSAGVWALSLGNARGDSYANVGFRAALYL